MDNPTQQLLHLTSRGSSVRTRSTGLVGQFANLTSQPINNVNKFGLLHYSIPKTLDLLNAENRSFNIVVNYEAGPSVTIPVTLPVMDYYNITLDDIDDNKISLAEILQTTINWAIQEDWTKNKDVNSQQPFTGGQSVSNRLGCIVQLTPDGRFQFVFGYRGQKTIMDSSGHKSGSAGFKEKEAAKYADEDDVKHAPPRATADDLKIQINTGAPIPARGEAAISNRNFPGVLPSVNGEYKWIATDGTVQVSPGFTDEGYKTVALRSVFFTNLPERLQYIFGCGASDVASQTGWLKERWVEGLEQRYTDALYLSRGRMLLVNYQSFHSGHPRLGLINVEMEVRPNIFPPSFLFLALTIQGTKSKVLGHAAERGGWSVPTSANQFKSKYDNLPKSDKERFNYSPYDVRQPAAALNLPVNKRTYVVEGSWLNKGEPSNQFDQLPFGAGATAYTDSGEAGFIIKEIDNFSLTTAPTLNNQGKIIGSQDYDYDLDHRWGSRLVLFGDTKYKTAPATKRPRGDKQFGQFNESPTFTVSMIDANWIYTDVPNSTLQTLGLKLLWGDTADPVTDTSPYPVQITMIASQ